MYDQPTLNPAIFLDLTDPDRRLKCLTCGAVCVPVEPEVLIQVPAIGVVAGPLRRLMMCSNYGCFECEVLVDLGDVRGLGITRRTFSEVVTATS